MIINDDAEAWKIFPQYRIWFNKLWLSEKLGYLCGPGGIPVPTKNFYIVRPIYNLRGMGAGSKIIELSPTDIDSVPPGYFWCEQFTGNHYSLDLEWTTSCWAITSCYQGINNKEKLYKFHKWIKSFINYQIPSFLDQLQFCKYINIEIIDNKIIEVHLRVSPDPQYTEIIPVWENEEMNLSNEYKWIESPDDADGFIPQKRLGFMVK